mgnify:CR=1 FL=1
MIKKIALVCCRGGSKGVPKKNIKLFNGKPLLYWTFNNIKSSKLFDTIFLSTDSPEIAKIAEKIGFVVPGLRPSKLATDNSDVFETHKYFFKKHAINNKNSLVCIINNNPFISSSLIVKTFKKFRQSNFNNITMCAIKVDTDQIFYRQATIKRNKLFPLFEKNLKESRINRQNQKVLFFNTGDLRWGKPSVLNNYKKFNIEISKNGFKFVEIKKKSYQDINNYNDWKIAEKKFKSK